nr:hypothetical protein [Tanacetum cinerariifolium]
MRKLDHRIYDHYERYDNGNQDGLRISQIASMRINEGGERCVILYRIDAVMGYGKVVWTFVDDCGSLTCGRAIGIMQLTIRVKSRQKLQMSMWIAGLSYFRGKNMKVSVEKVCCAKT